MRRPPLKLVLASAAVCALGVIVAAIAIATPPAVALAQPEFEFKLGFKALADQIPEVVGEPLEYERWDANGDSIQLTTGGLLVYRKADNSTRFTNGFRTWVNGPYGIQERGNDEMFEWEATTPMASPGEIPPNAAETRVILFRPVGVEGPALQGRCSTPSLASFQSTAWQCESGGEILEPCFSSGGNDSSVICGATPLSSGLGFRLTLTEPLPPPRSEPEGQHAWTLALDDGTPCSFLPGATKAFEGQRLSYACSDGGYILGDPLEGRVWTAEKVRLSPDGSSILEAVRALMRTVWV